MSPFLWRALPTHLAIPLLMSGAKQRGGSPRCARPRPKAHVGRTAHRGAWVSIAISVLLHHSPSARADDADARPGDGEPASQLQEVVVTAQKRAQSNLDTPVTVSAFSGSALKDLHIDTAKDLQEVTPGLTANFATSGGTPIFAIRGIGLDDFSSNNSSGVGVYVDEVLSAFPVFLNGEIFDVSQVEVLKGPQGTLYGRNTTGGAINFVSNKPSSTFGADLSVDYGRWNDVITNGDITGALSDSVNARFAFTSDNGDYWQHDIHTGAGYADPDKFAARALFAVAMPGDASVLLNVHYSQDRGRPNVPENPQIDSFYGLPAGTIGTFSSDPAFVDVGTFDVRRDEFGAGLSGTLTAHIGSVTFTSISAYDHYRRVYNDNEDGAAVHDTDVLFNDYYDVASQEFRLASDPNQRITWLAGAVGSFSDVQSSTAMNAGIAYDLVNATLDSRYRQDSISGGFYVHGEAKITDAFHFLAGARYSYDVLQYRGGTLDEDGIVVAPGTYASYLHLDRPTSNVSYTTGLSYKFDDYRTLVYGNYSTGYKGAVVYSFPAIAQGVESYVTPETVRSTELGFKTQLLENRLDLDGAVYVTDYRNRQSSVTLLVDDSDVSTLANVPKSQIKGGELQMNWLTPLTGLTLRGGFGHIESSVSGTVTSVGGEALLEPIENGQPLPQSPRWTYNGNAEYVRPVFGDYDLVFTAKYSWSGVQLGALNDPNAVYGPISDLGIRLSISPQSDKWAISPWMENVLNNDQITYAYSNSDGSRSIYRQMPRTYGVTFRWKY